MINKTQRAMLLRLVHRIKLAAIAVSYSGSQHPSNIPSIVQELKDADAALQRYLEHITEPPKP